MKPYLLVISAVAIATGLAVAASVHSQRTKLPNPNSPRPAMNATTPSPEELCSFYGLANDVKIGCLSFRKFRFVGSGSGQPEADGGERYCKCAVDIVMTRKAAVESLLRQNGFSTCPDPGQAGSVTFALMEAIENQPGPIHDEVAYKCGS